MSCFIKNPQPPRVWSRVSNFCLSDNFTTNSQILDAIAMLNKGNVLQYKKNSSNLTQNQRYSKIINGNWSNRTTTQASQSDSNTNPNTKMLKRVNTTNITTDGTSTTAPLTCIQKLSLITNLPKIVHSGKPPIPTPPPPPPPIVPGGTSWPVVSSTTTPTVINSGGNLICNVVENPCTGESIISQMSSNCNPTTASDVPGPIQELCYANNTPTWYPRQRYTMNNSTTKWPANAKLTS